MMQVSELKEYLGMIIDAEENLSAQTKALSMLQSKLDVYNHRIFVTEYHGERVVIPSTKIDMVDIVVSTIMGAVPGFLAGFICFFVRRDMSFIIGVIFLLLATVFLIKLFKDEKVSNAKKAVEDAKRAKQKALNEVAINKVNKLRNDAIKKYLTDQKNILSQHKSTTESLLRLLYDCNFIHTKYKRLDFVALIYECLDTGRCDRLEGPDGAYNKVELDYRLDKISSQLGTIINQLGDIRGILEGMRRDQALILSNMNNIDANIGYINKCVDNNASALNQSIENAKKTIHQIEGKSDLFIYDKERTEREKEYLNRINYLKSRNEANAIG